ncbi:MAG TPA: hypothetical protein VK607_03300 [Kofleriaceae bacterium]|nr:hypothetical protein [Kofleriaceae bacterium]
MKGGRNMGSTKHAFVHAITASALPAPYQLAIEDCEFRTTVLDDHAPRDHDSDCAVVPPMWFSVTLTEPTHKRHLYLVQQETDTGLVVVIMLVDRSAEDHDGGALRLPSRSGWLRAVVDGTVYVLASDLVLSRKAITAWIGGREPPTTPPQPPYT